MNKEKIRSCTVDIAKTWSDIVDELRAGIGTSIELSTKAQHAHLKNEFLDMDESRAKVKALMLLELGLISPVEHRRMRDKIDDIMAEVRDTTKNRTTEIKED